MSAEAEWARCRHWIEAALEYGAGTHNYDDVTEMVRTGRAQFWSSPTAAAVTEIIPYPRFKCLSLWLCGGDLKSVVGELFPQVILWGEAMGCSKALIAGRPGWVRVFKSHGFEPVAHMCMKELT